MITATRPTSVSLWLQSRKHELLFFHLPGLAVLLLLIPYYYLGPGYITTLYIFHVFFFSNPHIFFMCSMLNPQTRDNKLSYKPVLLCLVACLIFCSIYLIKPNSSYLTIPTLIISYWGLWHIFMQHLGIMKIYDQVQAKRTNDLTIVKNGRFTALIFAMLSNSALIWTFTQDHIEYELFLGHRFRLNFWTFPPWVFDIYLIVLAVLVIFYIYHVIIKRNLNGLSIPWPQIGMMSLVSICNCLPYIILPKSGFAMALLITSIYHNVQYFGYVWLFEKFRLNELNNNKIPLAANHGLILNGRWMLFFLLALIFSSMILLPMAIFPVFGTFLLFYASLSHYTIDGFIWRKKYNGHVVMFLNSLIKSNKSSCN